MSEAYQCDRCDNLYQGKPVSTVKTDKNKDGVRVIGDPHLPNETLELCEHCSKKTKDFFKLD